MTKLKLAIELVPSSSWQNNLRTILTTGMWNDIRKKVIEKYNNKCAICERSGKMHAHEVWSYDDTYHLQKLIDIIPLCYMCHMVKHIGFASIHTSKKGESFEKFIKYFMSVNKVDRIGYQKHLKEVLKNYEERSKYEWQLDLNKLKDYE